MRLYTDYLDNLKLDEPYSDQGEQVRECVALLDLIVESMIDRKLPSSGDSLFSRGLLITEAEMKSLIATPPFLRGLDEVDALLPSQVRSAVSHIRQRTSHTDNKVFCPISNIKKVFQLDDFDTFAMIVAFAAATDLRYSRIFGFLQDDITKLIPTVGLVEALYMFGTDKRRNSFRDHFEEGSKLRNYILDIRTGAVGLLTPIRLRPRITVMMSGNDSGFVCNNGIVSVVCGGDEEYPFYENIRERLCSPDLHQVLYIETSDSRNIHDILSKISLDTGISVLKVDAVSLVSGEQAEALTAIRDVLTEMRLARIIVWICGLSAELMRSAFAMRCIRMIVDGNENSVVLFSGDEDIHGQLGRLEIGTLSIDDFSTSDRVNAWKYFISKEMKGLTLSEKVNIADISDCYAFSPATIRKIVIQASIFARAEGRQEVDRETLMRVIFDHNKANFGVNATQINAVYDWNDIEMEDSQKNVLLTACKRYKIKNRVCESYGLGRKNAYGNGVSILLYGPPGTGKTMAAQVVANEVGLQLFRVDLSQISSKYIGETQKNIGAIFDEASRCNVLLFFDEADSLFSKRTQVNDSNDKHANAETAYLLQRIEEYSGICVLATNFYNNFDPAFVRRITYAVRLSNPSEDVRIRLWKNILPNTVPKANDIDLEFFARQFELSGSNIKAILLSATYMAAAENAKLGNSHIVRAMKYEFEKLGKMVNTMEFGSYGVYLTV